MSEVITHLWSSTLVLLIALIAARLLPLTARTRYVALLCGLAKFAIPSVAITAPLAALGLDLTNIGRRSTGVISMEWLGGPATLRTLPSHAATRWPLVIGVAWIVSAAALAIGWAIARRRLVSSALHAASAAAPRERAALAAARRDLGLRTSVEVMRSAICEAPAVVRIIRPVVVLPDGGCDVLNDTELESLLRHECAHVARRDNLVGLCESAIAAAFWFHPLIWIAQRAVATAREEACDETAASSEGSVDSYVSALSKICSALVAPRLAGVSCMASAHLKERLNHIMSYESLRSRALSHRFVVAFAAVAVLAVTVGSGLHAAASSESNDRFKLYWSIVPGDLPDRLTFTGRVVEGANSLLVAAPSVSLMRGSSATASTVAEGRDVRLEIRDSGSTVNVVMRISENGVLLQESTYSGVPKADGPRNKWGRSYTGAPISVNLKNADIKDVLDTFEKITSTHIQYPKTLQGSVTLDVKDMPWDEAMDIVLEQNHLTYELKGDAIIIKK